MRWESDLLSLNHTDATLLQNGLEKERLYPNHRRNGDWNTARQQGRYKSNIC